MKATNGIIRKILRSVIRVAQFNFMPFSPLAFRVYALFLASNPHRPDAEEPLQQPPVQI
jgi:hypothetical protein